MNSARVNSINAKAARKLRRQLLVAWIFAAVWLVFVGAFDAYFAWTAVRQVTAADSWKQVTGTITRSEVVSRKGRKGKTTHRPSIGYSYSVDGKRYDGSTIHAFGIETGGQKYSQDIVGSCPVGASVPVFVDPGDSARAALRVGVQPATMRMLLFSLPFNAVLLGLIPFLFRARGYAMDPTQGWVVEDTPDRAVLRVLHMEPWTLGCLAFGVASLVGLFAILVPNRGDPPSEQVVAAIVGSVCVGCVLYGWRRAAVSAGRFDIEIDRRLKRVSLPRTSRSMERPSFRYEQLEASIEPDLDRQLNRSPTWRLHLRRAGATDGFTAHWLERSTAKLIGRWIANECGVRLRTMPAATGEGSEADSDGSVGA